jgi:outer membrane protein
MKRGAGCRKPAPLEFRERMFMKRIFMGGTVFFVVLFLTMSVAMAADSSVKISTIDVQKILRESKAAKTAKADLMKDVEQKRAQLIAKDKEIKELDQELKDQNAKLSSDERQIKAEKLAREVKELRRLDADLTDELKKKEIALTQKLLGELRRVAQAFLKDMKYTLILEKNSVIASDGAVDVTDKIIKLYDAQNK